MSAVSNGDERAAYSRTTLHPFLIKYLTSVNVHWGYIYSLPSGRDCCLSSISLRFSYRVHRLVFKSRILIR